MKKLFILCFIALPYLAQAQGYRKLFFGIDVGVPMGEHSRAGSFTLEPGFRLNDKMSLGLRLEQIGLISSYGGNNTSLASIGLSYQYYLPVKKT